MAICEVTDISRHKIDSLKEVVNKSGLSDREFDILIQELSAGKYEYDETPDGLREQLHKEWCISDRLRERVSSNW